MRIFIFLGCILFFSQPNLFAADHIIIIAGKGGQPDFAEKHAQFARQLHDVLTVKHGFAEQQITVFAENIVKLPFATMPCTAEKIQQTFAQLANGIQRTDLVAVILFGHGTYDGDWAKFNLAGPDLRDLDWAQLLDRLPAERQIVVNTTAASGPFIEKLSKPNRVVITATRSGDEQYATTFPEFFVEAFLKSGEADLDKNGNLSLLEAFDYSRDQVVRFYENANRLRPEHPLLDDNGDGNGSETPAANVGDGQLAARTFLIARASATLQPAGISDSPLEKEKGRLLAEIENLKARKSNMPEPEYNRKIEELFIRLARLNRQIKSNTVPP
jgi:hypothetical protein